MVCNRKKMPPSGRRTKDEGRKAKGKRRRAKGERRRTKDEGRRAKGEGQKAKGERTKDESIAQHRYCRQPFVNCAPLVLSHHCRTSQTMHRQPSDNASPRLSDPCGTSTTLPLPRPSRTTKPTSHRLAASSLGMNANATTPPSVIPQPSVEDTAARKSPNKFDFSLPSSYLCRVNLLI